MHRTRSRRRSPLAFVIALTIGVLVPIAAFVAPVGQPVAGAAGTTYFVSPSGNDSWPGTPAQPWRTVGRALTGRAPGDLVRLEPGAVFTENIRVASTGAAGSPVVVTSDPTNRATIRQASTAQSALYVHNRGHLTFENLVLTGAGAGLTSKMGIEAYADNGMYGGLTFRNLTVTGFYRGLQFIGYGGGSSFGFDGILLDRVESSHNLDAGALTWGSAAGAIRNLVVRDSRFAYNLGDPASTKNSGNGFSAGSIWDGLFQRVVAHDNGGQGNATEGPVGVMVYDSKRVTIEHSEAYRNRAKYQDGDGFDLDLGTSDSVIQYCYTHDNYGAGILLSTDGDLTTWTGNVVRYNISENDGWGGRMGGLHLYSPGTLAPLRETRIYGNTVYSAVAPAVWFYSFANMAGITLRNNIFATSNGHPVVRTEVTPSPTTAQALFQGNNYWSYGGTFSVAGYGSLAAWRTAKGQELLAGAAVGSNVDPGLVAPGAGGTIGDPSRLGELGAYRLRAGSPLIDSGLALRDLFGTDPGPSDFHGTALPQGAGLDVGASEFTVTTPPTRPAAPSGLTTTTVTSSSIGLAWVDNATNEVGYRVERSTDATTFTPVATSAAGSNSFTDTALPSGVTRWYRVIAFNAAGDSDPSAAVSATTTTVTPPSAPTGLTATRTAQKGQIALSWSSSAGATSYTVLRATTAGGPYSVVASGLTTTRHTDTGLRSRTTYHYVVRAHNAAGMSAHSNVASATTR